MSHVTENEDFTHTHTRTIIFLKHLIIFSSFLATFALVNKIDKGEAVHPISVYCLGEVGVDVFIVDSEHGTIHHIVRASISPMLDFPPALILLYAANDDRFTPMMPKSSTLRLELTVCF